MYSFSQQILHISYVPGPVLDSGYSREQDRHDPCTQLEETEEMSKRTNEKEQCSCNDTDQCWGSQSDGVMWQTLAWVVALLENQEVPSRWREEGEAGAARKGDSGRRNSKYKGGEARSSWISWRNSKE